MIVNTKTGELVYYQLKVEKIPNGQMYDPVSYENWKMLRELQPTKFKIPYNEYVELRNEEFLEEVERRKLVDFEIKTIYYKLTHEGIMEVKERMLNIQSSKNFNKWLMSDESVQLILNYGNNE